MSTTVWKGNLHLGFDIKVPIRLTSAARAEKIEFTRVNPETGAKVAQQLVDGSTGKLVKAAQLVKETSFAGEKVRVTSEELAALKAEDNSILEVLEFVKLSEIDPIHFNSSYHVQPACSDSVSLFQMFCRALGESKFAAVGQVVIRQREHLVVIRRSTRDEGSLILHTLFYESEIRDHDRLEPEEIDEKALSDAKCFIRAQAAEFSPEKYSDGYLADLKDLLKSKAEAKTASHSSASPFAAPLKKARKARRKARRK